MLVTLGAEPAGRCPRDVAAPGAARPLAHPLDFDTGVIVAALRAAANDAGTSAALLRGRAARQTVDGILVCQQADGDPESSNPNATTGYARLLQHAMWAPTQGATYLVVAAADTLSRAFGVIDANSAAASQIRSLATPSPGAAGPVTL